MKEIIDQTKLDQLNEWMLNTLGIEDSLTINEHGFATCYGFTIGYVEEENVFWITFNDEISTSHLIAVALDLIPFLDELLNTTFNVIECYAPAYNKGGTITSVLYESQYNKAFKKKPKEKK